MLAADGSKGCSSTTENYDALLPESMQEGVFNLRKRQLLRSVPQRDRLPGELIVPKGVAGTPHPLLLWCFSKATQYAVYILQIDPQYFPVFNASREVSDVPDSLIFCPEHQGFFIVLFPKMG